MKSVSTATTILLIGIIIMSGCSNQLDVVPKDRISRTQLSVGDIDKLKIGLYSLMEGHVFTFLLDFDIRGENFQAGPAFALVDPLNMDPTDGTVGGLWRNAYSTLTRVNFLIETIDALDGESANVHQSTKGESLVFRAMIYYNLVTRWGGVPILTKQTYDVVPRATEDQVWAQIEADLLEAERLLGDFSNRFYVSKQAAQALLARVYLSRRDFANAIKYADLVINHNKFGLVQTSEAYASMFSTNSNANELIFSLANNNTRGSRLLYQNVNDVDGSWPYAPSAWAYANLFADDALKAGDRRLAAVFSSTITNRIIKYPNGVAGQQFVQPTDPNQIPISIVRFSEIYLIKAEAQGAQAGSATLVPYFQSRYATSPVASEIASLAADAYQTLLLNERRREFYAEGHWWFDIKRTGRKELLTTLNGRDYLLNYPIPQNERDLAGYSQNDGY